MQAASDIFLGWTEDAISGRHFYVRQLKNRRLGSISELVEEKALVSYARLCGRTLARAHARSGDPAMIAGYMGKNDAMDNALASFAMAYAKRTQAGLRPARQGKGAAARRESLIRTGAAESGSGHSADVLRAAPRRCHRAPPDCPRARSNSG